MQLTSFSRYINSKDAYFTAIFGLVSYAMIFEGAFQLYLCIYIYVEKTEIHLKLLYKQQNKVYIFINF